jgi:hypothetical protein
MRRKKDWNVKRKKVKRLGKSCVGGDVCCRDSNTRVQCGKWIRKESVEGNFWRAG